VVLVMHTSIWTVTAQTARHFHVMQQGWHTADVVDRQQQANQAACGASLLYMCRMLAQYTANSRDAS
jgi:hypothetical protein